MNGSSTAGLPVLAPAGPSTDTNPAAQAPQSPSLFRYSARDGLLVSLALVHGVLLLLFPSIPLIALGLWWNSNTISHCFLHAPFFRRPLWNRAFSLYLSVLLGIPQRLWRDQHLCHHASRPWRRTRSLELTFQLFAILGLWTFLAVNQTLFFLEAYLPGYVLGLLLCQIHGYFEHYRGGTISHYGWLYNLVFFNDGFHFEHHQHPRAHWTQLPAKRAQSNAASSWPAVLRWIECISLDSLEWLALHSQFIQSYLLQSHFRAFQTLLPDLPPRPRVAIVGGGIFPRTAILLKQLVPSAHLTIIDAAAESLALARSQLQPGCDFSHHVFDLQYRERFDIVVIPLSYRGDLRQLYLAPPAPLVFVHDWLWNVRGKSTVISWLLLKRLNRVGA